jgi:alpha-ribazole phosphatase
VTRVILVRHGSTEWNHGHRFQGHQDVPLSELGAHQAQRVAHRLHRERLTCVYTSDLQRARQTAEALASVDDTPLNVTSQLREMSFGAWEGLTAREVQQTYPHEWKEWVDDPVHTTPPGGESLEQLAGRVTRFLETTIEGFAGEAERHRRRRWRGPTLVFVGHGGCLRAIITHLLDIPLERYWRFAIRPGSITILDLYPEGAIAAAIGETGHLEGLRG